MKGRRGDKKNIMLFFIKNRKLKIKEEKKENNDTPQAQGLGDRAPHKTIKHHRLFNKNSNKVANYEYC